MSYERISSISKIKEFQERLEKRKRRPTEVVLFWSSLVPETYSKDFLQRMLNRRMFGHFRHEIGTGIGSVGSKRTLDAIKLLKVKLGKYEKTGNLEMLVDVANYAMMEFQHPKHPKAHFNAEDDGESDRYKK